MSAVKKSVWMRLGVRMELTEEELRLIQESNDGTVIMMNKLKNGEFTISGDSYIPEEEGDDETDENVRTISAQARRNYSGGGGICRRGGNGH